LEKMQGGNVKRFLASAILLAIAGCAGPQVREDAITPAPGEKVLDLRAGSYFFDPARISLPAGESVVVRVFTESGIAPHSFVLAGPDGKIIARRELNKGGETFLRVPPLPAGTYAFSCDKSFLGKTHRERGMRGELIVTAPGTPGK
jgi:plastocyanin